MHVAVYGNLIYDQLMTIDSPLAPGESHNCIKISNLAGGIANFCRAGQPHYSITSVSSVGTDDAGTRAIEELKKYGKTQIKIDPDHPTSQALVIVDPISGIRTGIVKWGACRQREEWIPMPVSWHHIMYLDRVKMNKEVLSRFPGTISADFCNIDDIDRYQDCLKYIDYLIVSEMTHNKLMHKAVSVRKGLIVHNQFASYFVRNGIYREFRVPYEKGLNVVGAGDYFAANCIANLSTDKDLDLGWIHTQTVDRLRKQS